ncbi:hypothetical protein M3194_20950 [Paenibacillus glycanilyticus]|uniref:DUF6756 family protein n=1 Tax=Paenibacillus glycanilyticus TaxID=126569 RepID=UPI00204040EC|nr:DUF6756 family protein [Paenibacillus glycanilyticus]MCM3629806.1 hypothetical protein [Paenibacillus glycanilyticus]
MDHLSIRDEIGALIKSQKNHEYFTEVNKNWWKPVIQKIEERFIKKQCHTNSLHWGWLRLKEPQHLLRLVDPSEKYIEYFVGDDRLWFIVEDYKDKMWLYEGDTNFIIKKVIPQLMHLREYYLVSKKYEWLLCVSHHDIVYGTGFEVVNKMKQFEQENSEEIIRD